VGKRYTEIDFQPKIEETAKIVEKRWFSVFDRGQARSHMNEETSRIKEKSWLKWPQVTWHVCWHS